MSYTKRTWTCGDKITADALNNIENGVEEALECCADKGYECTESTTLLTNETVTTAPNDGSNIADLSYSQTIDADTIRVTFDGVEYICPKMDSVFPSYGAPIDNESEFDFSEYPFHIDSLPIANGLTTKVAGTHTVKIETYEVSAEVSECFKRVVQSVAQPLVVWPVSIGTDGSDKWIVTDKTRTEVDTAIRNGIPCYMGFYVNEQAICQAQDMSDCISHAMIPLVATTNFGVSDINGNEILQVDLSTDILITKDVSCYV